MSNSIKLHSGVLFDPLNPDPALITIEDVAYGLAGQFRYGGHSRMTVAQHAVLGSEMFGHTREALVFLHHDDSEGLGLLDIPSPIKKGMVKYGKAEATLQHAVGQKFGIELNEFQSPSIHSVDKRMGQTERFHIFGSRNSDAILLPISLFPLWSPEEAEKKYLERHHLLTSPQTFTTGKKNECKEL